MTTDIFSPQRPDDESSMASNHPTEPSRGVEALRVNQHEHNHVSYQQPVFFCTNAVDETHQYLLRHVSGLTQLHDAFNSVGLEATNRILNLVYRVGNVGRPLALQLPSASTARTGEWEGASVLLFDAPLSADELNIVRDAGSALASREIRPEIEDDE